MAAFFVQACQESAGFFGCLLDHKGGAADRAGFVNRFIPGRVAAVRVAVTAKSNKTTTDWYAHLL